MHEYLVNLVGRIGDWGYVVIFLVVAIECAAAFFLPGETLVLIGGFFAAEGELELGTLIVVVAVAAVLGYCAGYALGQKFGRARLIRYGKRFGVKEKHFQRVEIFFERYGGTAIFFGRFTSFMRAFVAMVAGMSGMRFSRFLFFNISGGIAWSITFTLIGYCVGAAWPVAEHWIARTALLVFLVIFIGGSWFWSRREKE